MPNSLEAFHALPLHHVNVGHCKVAYRRCGEGPALILVHGWPLSGSTYRGMLPGLSTHFTCYVPDLPGAGDSAWDPEHQEFFADHGARVAGFADALGLETYALFGHDSGGLMARIAASIAGPRVWAIGLSNTEVPGQDSSFVKSLQRAMGAPGAAWAFKRMLGSRKYLRSRLGFGGCFKSLDYIDGDFDRACVQPLRADPSGAIRSLRSANLSVGHRMFELHDRIAAPLLCVWGDADPFFPLAGAESMVERWPVAARLERLRGYKLFVHEEAPELVLEQLLPFLLEQAAAAKVAA